MIIELHAKTDVGRVRRANEDNWLVLDLSASESWSSLKASGKMIENSQRIEVGAKGLTLVVSDGMGGALAGDVASGMAIEVVRATLIENTDDELDEDAPVAALLVDLLHDATLVANLEIHRKGRENLQFSGMGATLTSAAIANDRLGLVQVGDSRAYLLRGEQIKLLTRDQSLVQQLIDAGQITEQQAETHQYRNIITQALGAQSGITPAVSFANVRQEDLLLLCSDGLSGKLRAADMLHIVGEAKGDLSLACQAMIDEANNRGGEDNITVILARFSGDDLAPATTDEITVESLTPANELYDAEQFADDEDITLRENNPASQR